MKSIAIALLSVWLFSCSSDESHEPVLLIAAHGIAGESLSNFVVTATHADGFIEEVICQSGAEGCPGDVAPLFYPGAPVVLDVRARGYQFYHASGDSLPVVDDSLTLVVTLEALSSFESTDNFATGFEEGGVSPFEALSYRLVGELGRVAVVKFYIPDVTADEPTVYFQNTPKHPLHYDFARNVLGVTLTNTQFAAETYIGEDRSGMAGTILWYQDLDIPVDGRDSPVSAPFCVTFFPADNLTPQQALKVTRWVEERLGMATLSGPNQRVFYLPAGSIQEEQVDLSKPLFAEHGTLWTRRTSLYANITQQILNPGLAYGTLRFLSPEELEGNPVSFKDVLVLPRLPNSLPIVAGTITEELQTPLAHVNVASRTRGTPNISLANASKDPRIAPLMGKLVRFEVTPTGFTLDEASYEDAEVFWDEQRPDPFVPEFDAQTDGLHSFAELTFHDWIFVGVKAANLAEVTHAIPDNAPDGFGVPFFYYNQHMQQTCDLAVLCKQGRYDCIAEMRATDLCDDAQSLCLAGSKGETLLEHSKRLMANSRFQGETAFRDACLNSLRFLVARTPVDPEFGEMLDGQLLETFGNAKARLRSSTNTEDLPNFTGAGLYDSVSARGEGLNLASKNIAEVWASVWNWKAYEERSFWNIDHNAVKMGVCVNRAYEDERANGVLITQNIADPTVAGMYANIQLGETSVTNPENGAIPEVVSIFQGPGGVAQVARQRFSSLSPDDPILGDSELTTLYWTATEVQEHFAPLYGKSPYSLALDIEFKFHGPERKLIIKQARPYAVK